VKKAKTKDDPFLIFFKEGAKEVPGILNGNSPPSKDSKIKDKVKATPSIGNVEQASEEELTSYWSTLRTFFRTGKGGGLVDKKGAHTYPALLSGYIDDPYMHVEYPFWIGDEDTPAEKGIEDTSQSLSRLLSQSIEKFASKEGEAKILKDNLLRMIVMVKEQLQKENGPVPFSTLIGKVLDEMEKKLGIKGEEGKSFSEDIEKLKKELPTSGSLIGFSSKAPLQIFAASLKLHLSTSRIDLMNEIASIKGKLKDILSVEKEKSPKAKDPKELRSSYDLATEYFNFDELSSILPESGSTLMPDDRHQRIKETLKILNKAGANIFKKNGILFIPKKIYDEKSLNVSAIFSDWDLWPMAKTNGAKEAETSFDTEMKATAKVIAALRIGQLEVENKYDNQVHGDYFMHFSWQDFTQDEMAACQSVFLIEELATLLGDGLSDFSHLLASNKPVKVLVLKRSANIDYRMNGMKQGSEPVFQQELGTIAVSHRNTYTVQSTAITPKNLFDGFSAGLKCFSPALFYVLTSQKDTDIDPYLWVSAAIEGRAFPGFTYNNELKLPWGSRFTVDRNPQPDTDWPSSELHYKDEGGQNATMNLSFTYADFAVLDKTYCSNYLIVPQQFWSDDLVVMSEYIEMSAEESYGKVPFIWMIDSDNSVLKVAVAWPIVLSCRERLDFWNYLQENAGINSYHVQKALENMREELQKELENEVSTINEEHEKAIKSVKDETAGETMERLTSFLLDMDSASLVPSPPAETATPVTEEVKETETPEPVAEEEEEELSLGEPWIESALCTSCNECTDISSKLFDYDADKLAFIADPKGGTFAQIVQAAEKCPVKIIHPGKPLDPSESGLDDLIKRADKFN